MTNNIKKILIFLMYLIIQSNALANYFIVNDLGLIEMQGNRVIKYQKDSNNYPQKLLGIIDNYWVDYKNKRIFKRYASGGDEIGYGPWMILGFDLNGKLLPFAVPNGYDLNFTPDDEIDVITYTYVVGISDPEDVVMPGESIGFRNYNAKTLVLNKNKKIDTLVGTDYTISYAETVPNIFCKVKGKYYGSFGRYGYQHHETDIFNFKLVFDNNLKVIQSPTPLDFTRSVVFCNEKGAYLTGTPNEYLNLSDKLGEITVQGKYGPLERCEVQQNFEAMMCFETVNEVVKLYKIDLKQKTKTFLWTIPKDLNVLKMTLSRTGKKIMVVLIGKERRFQHLMKASSTFAIIDRDNPKDVIVHTLKEELCCAIGFYSEE